MIKEIRFEVETAIAEILKKTANDSFISYLLFISNADFVHGLVEHYGYYSNCVADFQGDSYKDMTIERFYLRYMNRNYSSEGFNYEGEGGLDDLQIEMMIYSHIWSSTFFIKALRRLSYMITNKDYLWETDLPESIGFNYVTSKIINPLISNSMSIGTILNNCYKSKIRNSFAHSLYSINSDKRLIRIWPKNVYKIYSFEEFQNIFLHSIITMNILKNSMNKLYVKVAEDGVQTPIFKTPEGLPVFLKGEVIKRNNVSYPRVKLYKA